MGSGMATFGFKAAVFTVTPKRRPLDGLPFDFAAFGEGGLWKYLDTALRSAVSLTGHDDERKESYLRLDSVTSGGRLICVTASGGAYGDRAEIVDRVTGQSRLQVVADDAVLRDARTLLVVPGYGSQGVLLTEVRGRHHLMPSMVRRITTLLDAVPAVMRVDREIADDLAWATAFDNGTVQASELELVQRTRPNDRTLLTDNPAATKAKLTISLDKTTETAGRLVNAIQALKGQHPDGQDMSAQFTGIVGLRGYDDDDFDERHLVVVQDRQRRSINVTHGWPTFVYSFQEQTERPSIETFLTDTLGVAASILGGMSVDMPDGWVDVDLT